MAAPGALDAAAVPELGFAVRDARALRPAAAPTLRLALEVDAGGAPVRSLVLDVQVRIAAPRRRYAPAEQERLAELFGAPDRWGTTLRSLLWTHVTLAVPPFEGATVTDLDLPCTYDFEVAAARYLAALDGGEIPLELLFSGTVFHAAPGGGLRASRIGWDREAAYRLPVGVWREAMDRHFPGCAWLRVDRGVFDRLAAFRARRTLPSWEAALGTLLDAEEAAR